MLAYHFKKIHPATIYHVIDDKTLHACSFIRVCLFIRQFREYHRTFNLQSSSPLSYDNNDNGFHVFVSLLTYLFLPKRVIWPSVDKFYLSSSSCIPNGAVSLVELQVPTPKIS